MSFGTLILLYIFNIYSWAEQDVSAETLAVAARVRARDALFPSG